MIALTVLNDRPDFHAVGILWIIPISSDTGNIILIMNLIIHLQIINLPVRELPMFCINN